MIYPYGNQNHMMPPGMQGPGGFRPPSGAGGGGSFGSPALGSNGMQQPFGANNTSQAMPFATNRSFAPPVMPTPVPGPKPTPGNGMQGFYGDPTGSGRPDLYGHPGGGGLPGPYEGSSNRFYGVDPGVGGMGGNLAGARPHPGLGPMPWNAPVDYTYMDGQRPPGGVFIKGGGPPPSPLDQYNGPPIYSNMAMNSPYPYTTPGGVVIKGGGPPPTAPVPVFIKGGGPPPTAPRPVRRVLPQGGGGWGGDYNMPSAFISSFA